MPVPRWPGMIQAPDVAYQQNSTSQTHGPNRGFLCAASILPFGPDGVRWTA